MFFGHKKNPPKIRGFFVYRFYTYIFTFNKKTYLTNPMKTKLLLFFMLCILTEINAQQKIYDFTSSSIDFRKLNDKILLETNEADTGREIWESDGTTSGTKLIKDIYPGLESSVIGTLKTGTAINNIFYFIAKDESSLGEIWKSDGTTAGTVKMTSFINGRTSTLTAVGNSIYFLIKEDYKLQVWKINATTGVTVLVKDNMPISNMPTFQGKCNGTFIFTFQPSGTNNSRVWRSNGTSEGTFPITAEIDGNGSDEGGTAGLTQYIEKDNKLYFVSRFYLLETDGTLENTKTVANLWNAQNNLVSSGDAIEVDNNLFFMFFSADLFKLEIWKFDLINRNASVVYTNQSSQYFYPSNLAKTDDSLLFCGPNATAGTALLSMKLNDYSISYLKELAPNADKPFMFFNNMNRAVISKIKANEYFISSATDKNYESKGWISNLSSKLTENVIALDNVWNVFSYNDCLYYAKDNKLWKYANNLSIPLTEKKSSLVFYPNPSSDFINVEAENNATVEDFQIFDLNGRLVSSPASNLNNKIDVSRLNRGSYILKAKVNGTLVSRKIIKN